MWPSSSAMNESIDERTWWVDQDGRSFNTHSLGQLQESGSQYYAAEQAAMMEFSWMRFNEVDEQYFRTNDRARTYLVESTRSIRQTLPLMGSNFESAQAASTNTQQLFGSSYDSILSDNTPPISGRQVTLGKLEPEATEEYQDPLLQQKIHPLGEEPVQYEPLPELVPTNASVTKKRRASAPAASIRTEKKRFKHKKPRRNSEASIEAPRHIQERPAEAGAVPVSDDTVPSVATKDVVHCVSPLPKSSGDTCLGEDFVPGPWDVVCGRGKNWLGYVANRRFRILVALHLTEYFETLSRRAKSMVIDSIVDTIQNAGGEGFVKKKGRYWYRISIKEARHKVSHCMRDSLTDPQNEQLKWTKEDQQKKVREVQDSIFQSLGLTGEGQSHILKSLGKND